MRRLIAALFLVAAWCLLARLAHAGHCDDIRRECAVFCTLCSESGKKDACDRCKVCKRAVEECGRKIGHETNDCGAIERSCDVRDDVCRETKDRRECDAARDCRQRLQRCRDNERRKGRK